MKIYYPTRIRHIGTLPGCIALTACDLGEADLPDGQRLHITWGRNLTESQRAEFANQTTFDCVKVGTHPDAVFEVVLPAAIAKSLLSIATAQTGTDGRAAGWVDVS